MKATAWKLIPEARRDDAPDGDTWTEIWQGLSRRPKRLPCKLLYDAVGSELFEQITRLPEYYLTRCELDILESRAPAIARRTGPGATVVELGSGASVKTRLLLDVLDHPKVYVPIDISASALRASAEALRVSYPELSVRPVEADYTKELRLPLEPGERGGSVLAFFPGSTIGNFERPEAIAFLRRVRQMCGPRLGFVIGVDLPKDASVLEAAYDDASGVTAAFNRNLLAVINREHGAEFDLEQFEHRAVWNEKASRVEMHLVSRRRQRVRVGPHVLELARGEVIVTEHCYKYQPQQFRRLAETAGFSVAETWLDAGTRFAVYFLTPGRAPEASLVRMSGGG